MNKMEKKDEHHGALHDERAAADDAGGSILTIRAHSGLSGDMFLAGLLCMTGIDVQKLDYLLSSILPELAGTVRLTQRQVNHIAGWHAEVILPHQHVHRTFADISRIITESDMSEQGKKLSTQTFALLAEAEAAVHAKKTEDVQFHEVGALDSILDICLSCELFALLAPKQFIVSPLPIADGEVVCAHGVIPVPAPAVLELLEGVPVVPFAGIGETVTPTGIALLRSLGASFGAWPAMYIEKRALVYGSRIFSGAPNGTIFAYGKCSA